MNNFLKADALSVKKLFSLSDSLFQVPDYQRPYSWKREEVEQLWDDIYEAYKQKKENYFLGSVITVANNSGRQDIVDGQQRITTLIILFCVLRDNYPDLNNDDDIKTEDISVIRQKTIKSFIHDSEDRERIKLKPSVFEENAKSPRLCQSSHQNDFDLKILALGALKDIQDKIDKSQVAYKFLQPALIFKEKLNSLENNERGELVNYLGNYVHFVKITCQNRDSAFTMFQTLNARGMELTNADLIKSDLLKRLHSRHKKDKSKDKSFEEAQRSFVDDWKNAEAVIADCEQKSDMEDLFKLYVYSKSGSNPKGKTYEEMRKLSDSWESKDWDSNKIINDFKDFCRLYKERLSNTKNKNIHCFWYLNWGDYWRAIFLAALKDRPDDKEFFNDLAFELRRYYYLNWIAGKTVTAIKQTSFNVIKLIKEKKNMNVIKEKLEEHLQSAGILKIVLERLSSPAIDEERWVKPLLALIEYDCREGEESEYFNVFDRRVHLEHILPRGYIENPSSWRHITNETAERFLHSLANLTLLRGSKNITAGNKSFKDKIEIYKGKGADKGATRFEISRKIVDDFHQWNEQDMAKRRNQLLGDLEKALRIDLSSIKADG